MVNINIIFLMQNIFYFIDSNYLEIERYLINGCFLTLLVTTIYYWVNFVLLKKKHLNILSFYGLIIANIFLFLQLCLRWILSGHFPLSNLYDSLLFLSWCLLFIFIFLEKRINLDLLGIIISPVILCIVSFTDFSLPQDLQTIKPLVPALQSNWLLMHVTVMIFSYVTLILGSILAISYICYFHYLNGFFYLPSTLEFENKSNLNQNTLNLLDGYSYRLVGIGFCFLTLGILSGAIWANETWGNYWSWDPKETWALITWLIFAIYLHARLIGGLKGLKSAWIAFIGFIILWICYLGVNLLGKGLHTYGFLSI